MKTLYTALFLSLTFVGVTQSMFINSLKNTKNFNLNNFRMRQKSTTTGNNPKFTTEFTVKYIDGTISSTINTNPKFTTESTVKYTKKAISIAIETFFDSNQDITHIHRNKTTEQDKFTLNIPYNPKNSITATMKVADYHNNNAINIIKSSFKVHPDSFLKCPKENPSFTFGNITIAWKYFNSKE